MKIREDWLLLVGALLIIAALYNHYMGHSVLLFELILLAVGSVMGILSVWRMLGRKDVAEDKGLITELLSRYLGEKTISVLLPSIGLLLLVFWSAWKVLSASETNLRMEDFVVTLFALSLILYDTASSKYHEQRDFVLLYLLFLTIVFAGLWKLYTIITGESYGNVTAHAEYYFITIPVVTIVNLFGVDATAVLNLSGIGISNIIEYQYEGRLVRLGIGAGCSGLYSAGLFFSAFLSFVLVRYRTVNAKIALGLGVGLLVTWFSNILRMIVTIVVGAELGAPALATFHMYFGIIVFMCFVLVFWYFIVRWLDARIPIRSDAVPQPASAEDEAGAPSIDEPVGDETLIGDAAPAEE
ncbi:MAG: exosortase/archaeosortase family protein [Thermoplasmata archaeon]